MACPNIKNCPLFPLFSMKQSLKIWQISYCERDFERCARYCAGKAGKPVPANMLPSGDLLGVPRDGSKR